MTTMANMGWTRKANDPQDKLNKCTGRFKERKEAMSDSNTRNNAITRTEHDSLGPVEVPVNAWYGASTQRALSNFNVSGLPISMYPCFIMAYAQVKLACARANARLHKLDGDTMSLIDHAVSKVIEGVNNDSIRMKSSFPVDVYQGGAGTSTNMNVNEVIANLINIELGRDLGTYDERNHPNNIINMSQSTNDTYPTAAKIAIITVSRELTDSLEHLINTLHEWEGKHKGMLKLGRTQLQDAVPMTYGQEAASWRRLLEVSLDRIRYALRRMTTMTLGGTAIGTGIEGGRTFGVIAVDELRAITGIPALKLDDDLIAGTTDLTGFADMASALTILGNGLGKIADDLRILSSGPRTGFSDLRLPAVQAGSSIMPGKINPVIPEMMDQVVFKLHGSSTTVNHAVRGAQLQLCAFLPVIAHELLFSITLAARGMRLFADKAITGMEPTEAGETHASESVSNLTALLPDLGYDECSELAHEALDTGMSVHDAVESRYPQLVDKLHPASLVGTD